METNQPQTGLSGDKDVSLTTPLEIMGDRIAMSEETRV